MNPFQASNPVGQRNPTDILSLIGGLFVDTTTIDFTHTPSPSPGQVKADVKFPLLASVDGSAAAPAYTFASQTTTGFFKPVAGAVDFTSAGAAKIRFGFNLNLTPTGLLQWGSIDPFTGPDVSLGRYGEGVIALRGIGSIGAAINLIADPVSSGKELAIYSTNIGASGGVGNLVAYNLTDARHMFAYLNGAEDFRGMSIGDTTEVATSNVGGFLQLGRDSLLTGDRNTITFRRSGFANPTNLNTNSDGDKIVRWNDAVTKHADGTDHSNSSIDGEGYWFQHHRPAANDSSLAFSWHGGNQANTKRLAALLFGNNRYILYNNFTDESNYEYIDLGWTNNVAQLLTGKVGTGTARDMQIGTSLATDINIVTNNSGRWKFNSSGHLLAMTDIAYDIGASGANRPRDLFVGRHTTLGANIGDDLTINASDWTYGNNWVANRNAGTLPAGNITLMRTNTTYTGDVGGASNPISSLDVFTSQGANAFGVIVGKQLSIFHSASNIANFIVGLVVNPALLSTGNVSNSVGIQSAPTLNSTSSITGTFEAFRASTPSFGSSGTIANNYGLRVIDISHAQVTNAIGISISDFSGASTVRRSIDSFMSAGVNKYNLYLQGSAVNYMQGGLILGTSGDPEATGNKVLISGNLPTASGQSRAFAAGGSIPSGTTTDARIFYSAPSTVASVFTLPDLYHFLATDSGKGDGSTITRQIGFFVGNLTAGDSNRGFQGNLVAGTNKYNLYMSGNAVNWLKGKTSIGSGSTVPSYAILNLESGGAEAVTGNPTGYGVSTDLTTASDVTSIYAFNTVIRNAVAAYTVNEAVGYRFNDLIKGAGSTVTTLTGLKIQDLTTGSNNRAIHTLVSSGTNKWNLYLEGTARNALAGELRLNSTLGFTSAFDGTPDVVLLRESANTLAFQTSGVTQARIVHTASSTRSIDLTGSNGGNPTISVSAGSLNLGSPTTTANQFTSTLATGTSPFAITSTTVNANLNADMVDGQHASAFATVGHDQSVTLSSGVYTPTATGVTNMGTASPFSSQYMRVGNTVTVSGKVNVDPTSASTLTRLRLTLPIASDIQNDEDVAGIMQCFDAANNAFQETGVVRGDGTNNEAFLEFHCGSNAGSRAVFFHFSYQIQ